MQISNTVRLAIALSVLSPTLSFAATCDMSKMEQLEYGIAPQLAVYSLGLKNDYLNNCTPSDLSAYLDKHKEITMAVLTGSKFDASTVTTTLNTLNNYKNITLIGTILPQLGDQAAQLIAKTSFPMVYIDSDNITDASVNALASMTSLKWLGIYSNSITDNSVKTIATFPSLENLQLSGKNITDASASYWANTHLKYINLQNSAVSDGTATTLASLASLNTLDLNDTQVTETGAAALAKSTSLTNLSLEGLNLGQNGQTDFVTALASNSVLTTVDLAFNQLTDADMQILSSNHHISSLAINTNLVADAGVMSILNIPTLTSLTVGDVLFNTPTYQAIANAHITTFSIQNHTTPPAHNLTDADVAALASGHFTSLTLAMSGVTDAQAEQVANLPGLTYLDLGMNNLTDSSVSALASHPSIQYLDVSSNELTSAGISILRHTPSIKYLFTYGQMPA